jgi:hypothetical protein
MSYSIFVLSLLLPTALMAASPSGENRWVSKLRLNSEVVVVVAEGDMEPRSTGSFTVPCRKGVRPLIAVAWPPSRRPETASAPA